MHEVTDSERLAIAEEHIRRKIKGRSRDSLVVNGAALDIFVAEFDRLRSYADKARALHTMERRYTDESYERSYDTRQEAADALGITPGAAVYLDVCSHCGSIEMDAGAEDYRESLWPCADARALGLGEEGTEPARACDHRQCPPSECRGC